MEAALNLCWVLVVGLLCAVCVVAHRRDCLRVSFGAALTCSLLLAVLLFPAISMTDDLEHARLEAEGGPRSMEMWSQGSQAEPAYLILAVVILALVALGARVLARLATIHARQDRLPQRVLWHRPAAVRPPTFVSSATV